jgi:hypothetical protein
VATRKKSSRPKETMGIPKETSTKQKKYFKNLGLAAPPNRYSSFILQSYLETSRSGTKTDEYFKERIGKILKLQEKWLGKIVRCGKSSGTVTSIFIRDKLPIKYMASVKSKKTKKVLFKQVRVLKLASEPPKKKRQKKKKK